MTRLERTVRVSVLAGAIGLPFEGADFDLDSVQPLSEACDGSLTFSSKPVTETVSHRVAIIAANAGASTAWIPAEQPRLAFAKALAWLDREAGFVRPGGDPEIHPTVEMGSGVWIGRGVVIGEGTVLGHNIRIADGVRIGRDCRIKSGSVLGEDGFGFERDTDGTPHRMLHLGGLVIGDRVEIGSLNTVCQGTLSPTIIEDDVKMDDHVHIAHNCRIGRQTMITGAVVLAGGVTVGEQAWLSGNAVIMNGLTIGDRAFVGLGAVVIRDVPPDTTVVGNPGRPLGKGV